MTMQALVQVLASGLLTGLIYGLVAVGLSLIFGLMEAFRQLDFAYGSRIMAEVLALFGQVVFGAIIIFAAVIIARLVARVVEGQGESGTRAAAPKCSAVTSE